MGSARYRMLIDYYLESCSFKSILIRAFGLIQTQIDFK